MLCSVSWNSGGKGVERGKVVQGGGGEERSDVPLPGLPLFLVFFWQRFHPGNPGAFGILELWGHCSGSGRGQGRWQDEELAMLSAAASTQGCSEEAPEQQDCWCWGRLSLLLPLGSPVRMQRDEWIH